MKILLVHNFYQSSSPSGEDSVFRNEVDLLKKRGVEVITYERGNDEIRNPFEAASNTVWSRRAYDEVTALIRKEKPDLAHFHNIWYLISPSAYFACREAGIPVVQTLHNFRMFCTNGLLLRNGRPCEDCVGNLPWRSVAYGCFRNSRLYSLPVAFAEAVHRVKGTWMNAVDAYIALTEFARQKFIQCGLPADRIFVKPNFLADPPSPNFTKGDYAIYLGRLSQEKGLDVLLDAAAHYLASSHPLVFKIVGDGPMRKEFEKKIEHGKLRNITLVGRKSHAECMELLSDASFLIMPSVCYENFPMAIQEAFACGKPVITSRLGAMAEIVQHSKTGLLFNPGDSVDLAEKIRWMTENGDACLEMGKNARAEFEANHTADRNVKMLMDLYQSVIENLQKGK